MERGNAAARWLSTSGYCRRSQAGGSLLDSRVDLGIRFQMSLSSNLRDVQMVLFPLLNQTSERRDKISPPPSARFINFEEVLFDADCRARREFPRARCAVSLLRRPCRGSGGGRTQGRAWARPVRLHRVDRTAQLAARAAQCCQCIHVRSLTLHGTHLEDRS